MSKYYDSGTPFSLKNWNLLIADVNNILQNPPEDTNCEPIDTIAAASDPHLWSVEDIEEVRNKLKTHRTRHVPHPLADGRGAHRAYCREIRHAARRHRLHKHAPAKTLSAVKGNEKNAENNAEIF